MDPRLLDYYNRELQFLREMGAEYAKEFPKIAARLDLSGLACGDPYVERLLEGFAFLAARVHLKLDSEFPRFTQHLLQILYPHYLSPTPSMAVVELTPSLKKGSLADGVTVPRGASLKSPRGKGGEAGCEYRTAHDVTLLPIEIAEVAHTTYSRDLGGEGSGLRDARAALRIRLRALAGLTLDKIAADRLVFFVRGSGEIPAKLWEQVVGSTLGALVRPAGGGDAPREALPARAVRRTGFDDDQALLPFGARSFQGYRLLHEYFAFPERYLFFEVSGLQGPLTRASGREVDLVLLFSKNDPSLNNVVDAGNLALHCTPAVNLFPIQADTIHLSDAQHEYHVVADRTQPLDFEIWDVTDVVGTGAGDRDEQTFHPFYRTGERAGGAGERGYFTTHRVPRALSSAQKRKGARSHYVGSEVFLSLVDEDEAPYRSDLKQVHLKVRATNRDLPLHLAMGQGATDFTLQSGEPVETVRCVAGPTDPMPSFAEGAFSWRVVSHLSLNYLSIADSPDDRGAEALRELLALYAPVATAVVRKQIEGVRSVKARPVVRRLVGRGPIAFGRGLEVSVNFDESAFSGAGAFVLGAVLDEFFARYVSINSFTETVVGSLDRGELIRWPVRTGTRHAL